MPTPIVRVRIRGIYATALTKLLLDAGFQIVQASRIISERFRIPQLNIPADVTVKDADSPSELLVIGYPEHTDEVVRALRSRLATSFYWESRLPVHSTVRVKLLREADGLCIGEAAGVEVEVVDVDECASGRELVASVVRTAVREGERPRVRPGARVVGDYAMLYECQTRTVTFSEHIRSLERRALLASIAATAVSSPNLCVHWRSSAQHGEEAELRHHLAELVRKLEEVKVSVESGSEAGPVGGEKVVVVHLSSTDKRVLDELRRAVVPTAPLHHSLKSLNPELQEVVDLLDAVSRHVEPSALERGILDFLASRLAGRRLQLVHVRPDGSALRLGEAHVEDVEVHGQGLRLVLRRVVRSEGVYDGLGVAKEPGDVIETVVDTSAWYVIHRYYSPSGELKGVYVNVNTPPEVGLEEVRYLDLAVDVVRRPNEQPRILDLDELVAYAARGVVTREALERALSVVAEHAGPDALREELERVCRSHAEHCEKLGLGGSTAHSTT